MQKQKTNLRRSATGAHGALAAALLVAGFNSQASTDYGPAIWKPTCNANYYTTGSGHKFHVIHDMEGYYASVVSTFTSCNYTAASVHYAINGKQDASSDAPAGEIAQMVRDANYAWHARCWNSHCTGTEHEGFASNPAWYTEAQYQASAGVTRNLANKFGYAKDRNHIVGHGAKSSSAWVTWANANLGIDATCNTHTDPGPYWDWSHYMALVNNTPPSPAQPPAPLRFKTDVNGDGNEDLVLIWNNGGTSAGNIYLSDGGGYALTTYAVNLGGWATPNVDRLWMPMDVNGDGKTDMVLLWNNGGNAVAQYSQSTGTSYAPFVNSSSLGSWGVLGTDRQWLKGDFNGDGKEDLILIWKNGTAASANIYLSTGSGFTQAAYAINVGSWGTLNVDRLWFPMEVNGDGKTDLVLLWNSGGNIVAQYSASTGSGLAPFVNSGNLGGWGTPGVDRYWLKGDVNGDLKEDFILVWNNAGTASANVLLSNGGGYPAVTSYANNVGSWSIGLNTDRQYIPMDANGDGRTDLMVIWNNDGTTDANLHLSDGGNLPLTTWGMNIGGWGAMNVDRLFLPMDVNGDGKKDLVVLWNNGGNIVAEYNPSTGTGFAPFVNSANLGGWGTLGVDRVWLPPGM
jgi:N-acetyl-anhydromuramyl-L-alanine amidase AmpD